MSHGLRDTFTRLADHNLLKEEVGDTLELHKCRLLKPEQL